MAIRENLDMEALKKSVLQDRLSVLTSHLERVLNQYHIFREKQAEVVNFPKYEESFLKTVITLLSEIKKLRLKVNLKERDTLLSQAETAIKNAKMDQIKRSISKILANYRNTRTRY
jgi:hypothetical protein